MLETKGNQQVSRPLASIRIMEATHELSSLTTGPITSGKYYVIEVYDPNDPTIHFEGMDKIK